MTSDSFLSMVSFYMDVHFFHPDCKNLSTFFIFKKSLTAFSLFAAESTELRCRTDVPATAKS
jgi:hypothetical protein